MENWYLVHTKPSQERQVAVQLYQRGFGVYLPLIWVSPVNPRASRERPYFPGYVFTRLDLQFVGAHLIRWSPGVRGLVECNGAPLPISDAFVAELQQCLNRVRAVGGMDGDGARCADFLPVNQGPFEGYEGIFNARLHGADRARILLACVEQEFWRRTIQAPPAAGLSDDSAVPRA
jgi:transcriptional antiterminator RfaH